MKIKIFLFFIGFFPWFGFAQLSSEEKPTRIDEIVNRIKLPEIPDYSVILTDFGAHPDLQKDSKKAFDNALKALEKKGGGKLIVGKESKKWNFDHQY